MCNSYRSYLGRRGELPDSIFSITKVKIDKCKGCVKKLRGECDDVQK